MRHFLTNQQLPPDLSPVQKHRFLQRMQNYKLMNNKIVNLDGKIFSEDIKKDLQEEYKSCLGGRDKFYWFIKQKYDNITRKDCMDFINGNSTSQIHKKVPKPKVFKPIISNKKNERWECDFIMLPPIKRYNYVFTIIDHCTKHAFAIPTYSRGHKNLIPKIKNLFLSEMPQILQCDNEFKSKEFEKLCEESETQIINSSSYKPNCNGCIEKFNETFKGILFKLMTEKSTKEWPQLVPLALSIYNNSYHSVLKDSPKNFWDNNKSSVIEQKKRRDKLLEDAKEPTKFKVGDICRRVIQRLKSNIKNNKKYIAQYSTAKYEVISILKSDIPQYKIKNVATGQVLDQIFHNWDLLLSS